MELVGLLNLQQPVAASAGKARHRVQHQPIIQRCTSPLHVLRALTRSNPSYPPLPYSLIEWRAPPRTHTHTHAHTHTRTRTRTTRRRRPALRTRTPKVRIPAGVLLGPHPHGSLERADSRPRLCPSVATCTHCSSLRADSLCPLFRSLLFPFSFLFFSFHSFMKHEKGAAVARKRFNEKRCTHALGSDSVSRACGGSDGRFSWNSATARSARCAPSGTSSRGFRAHSALVLVLDQRPWRRARAGYASRTLADPIAGAQALSAFTSCCA